MKFHTSGWLRDCQQFHVLTCYLDIETGGPDTLGLAISLDKLEIMRNMNTPGHLVQLVKARAIDAFLEWAEGHIINYQEAVEEFETELIRNLLEICVNLLETMPKNWRVYKP